MAKNGIDYYEYIRSPQWRTKTIEAKLRAGNRCQVCNKHANEVQLDTHHRTYERLGNELPEDLTVLCHDCHHLYESNKRLPKPPLKPITVLYSAHAVATQSPSTLEQRPVYQPRTSKKISVDDTKPQLETRTDYLVTASDSQPRSRNSKIQSLLLIMLVATLTIAVMFGLLGGTAHSPYTVTSWPVPTRTTTTEASTMASQPHKAATLVPTTVPNPRVKTPTPTWTYVTVTPAPTHLPSSTPILTSVHATTTTGSNIRTGPGTSYSVIRVAKKGERVNIVGQNETALWYQLDNGGWISASLVDPAPEEMPIVVSPRPHVVAPKATATLKPISTSKPIVSVATPTPKQCNIKGNINYNTGEKIYHVPGQAYYEDTQINTAYGERWFCSEEEAIAAGWRKSYE